MATMIPPLPTPATWQALERRLKESGKKDKTETPARIAVIASLHIDHI